MQTQTKIEVVFLPSAVRPGTRFPAFTSAEIRRRNGQRWLVLQDRYRQRRFDRVRSESSNGLVEGIRKALTVAQVNSLVRRGYGGAR